MALINFGNTTANIFTATSTISRAGDTKFSYFCKFTYASGSTEVLFFNMGFEARVYRTVSDEIVVRIRTNTETVAVTAVASPTDGVEYAVLVTIDCDAGEGKVFVGDVQVGTTTVLTGTEVRGNAFSTTLNGSTVDGQDFKIKEAGQWLNVVPSVTGTSLADFTPATDHSYEQTGDGVTYVPTVTDTTGAINLSHTQGPVAVDNFPVADGAIVGPTLTGPASAQEGDAINAIGTGLTSATLDLVTTVGGHVGAQTTTGVPTDTMWPYTVNPKAGVPFSVVPIQAAGVTLWVTEQQATDGTSATNTMTIAAKTNETVIQGMIATSNTTPGESIFGTNILAMEDNLQANPPTLVSGVTITWFADGTFTVDMNQAISFTVDFFSPSNSEWQSISLNITAAGVISVGAANTKISINIGIGI